MNKPTDYTDFDDVLVDRIVAGRPAGCPIPVAEAAEVTRRLARQGFSDGQIAARLGFRRRSVIRIRNRLGIPAALTPCQNQYDRPHLGPNRPRSAG